MLFCLKYCFTGAIKCTLKKIFYGSEVSDHAQDLKYTEYSSTYYEVFIVENLYL